MHTSEEVSVGFPRLHVTHPHFYREKYIYKTIDHSVRNTGGQVAKPVGITSTKNLSAEGWKDPWEWVGFTNQAN